MPLEDYKRNQKYIGQGCLTNSKHVNCHVKGVYPRVVTSGRNSILKCDDSEEYIDFICGLGTNLFGYGNNKICSAISMAISRGLSHSLPSYYEGLAAESLCMLFPWVQKYKFLCTGSEACSAAVRIARAYTSRKNVLVEGYHGWHDAFTSLTPPAHGVPPHHNIELLKTDFSNIEYDTAAIIIEPIITDTSEARIAWLRAIRKLCKDRGIILIFDEVITGFRYDDYSVSQHYKIYPDLMCIGKTMGSGIPIAAVCGGADILDGEYFVSSTNAGSTAGLAAAIAACELLTGSPNYQIKRLWQAGTVFYNRFNKMSNKVKLEGYPTRGTFKGDALSKALFFQEACRAGILFGPSFFFNFDHIKDMEYVLDTCAAIFARIDRGEIQLEGAMPTSPFAEKVRNK